MYLNLKDKELVIRDKRKKKQMILWLRKISTY